MALTTHFSPLNLTSGKAISKSEQIHCCKKKKKVSCNKVPNVSDDKNSNSLCLF